MTVGIEQLKPLTRVFSLSFKPKKIVLQAGGLLAACLAYLIIGGILTWIFTPAFLDNLSLVVAAIISFLIVFITWGAISRMTITEIREDGEMSIQEAVAVARQRVKLLVLSPLKLAGVVVAILILHGICDLIGLIPGIGQLIWPFLAIPMFLLSAAAVVFLLVLVCGTLVLPAIIMTDKTSPISELNDFLRNNTLRFIGYFVIAVILFMLICAFLQVICGLNEFVSFRVMGEKYTDIAYAMPRWMKSLVLASGQAFNKMPAPTGRCLLDAAPSTPDLSAAYTLGALIWGVFLLIINLAIASIPFVLWCVTGTLIYLELAPGEEPCAAPPAGSGNTCDS